LTTPTCLRVLPSISMLLSIPSRLDALLPTTDQFECTQVEVSLDEPREACSIQVISFDSQVESIVSVPNHHHKRMLLGLLNRNHAPQGYSSVAVPRRAKSSKRSSASSNQAKSVSPSGVVPVPKSLPKSERRLSPRDEDSILRGRDTQSCPPAMSRRPEDALDLLPTTRSRSRTKASRSTSSVVSKRDTSCPPKMGARRRASSASASKGGASTSSGSRKRKVQRHPADSPTRRANKPDLVSQTSKRIIGSLRGSGSFAFANKRNRILPELSV
jgi:hypothetical protein